MSEKRKLERKAFGLRILKNSHPEIRKIRRETGYPEIHGNKLWKSAFLLMDYLKQFPPAKNCRVLEVGCGWGLAGIYCAKKFKAHTTGLDADDTVFPYMQYHADINKVSVENWKCRYENVRKADLKHFDLIIGSDICFWDSMTAPLYNLMQRAYKVGCRVVITDPGRPPYREMAEKCADKFDAIYNDWIVPHPHNASGLVLDMEPL